jgi:hypothetical protein
MGKIIVRTRAGHELTEHEKEAWKTVKCIIEREEAWGIDHAMADSFRSYFTEIEKQKKSS